MNPAMTQMISTERTNRMLEQAAASRRALQARTAVLARARTNRFALAARTGLPLNALNRLRLSSVTMRFV